MSDRIQSLTVALSEDIRDDDVQALVEAIRLLKHVANVSTNVRDVNYFVAESRVRNELSDKLWGVLWPGK